MSGARVKRHIPWGVPWLSSWQVKFSEFVREHLGEWPGPIIEEESGAVLGYHQGFWFHTVGQRKGVHLSGGPWYVSRKDVDTNAVYVSREYYGSEKQRNVFRCGDFNWIAGPPDALLPMRCKVRHGPRSYDCRFAFLGKGEEQAVVTLPANDQGLAPGQFAVFYQGDVCLGSGVILEAGSALLHKESSKLSF
jgi:tRNA-5-taurinomethyluridine 2-sulfurtransferase